MAAGSRSRGAAFGRFGSLADILHGFVRRIAAHVEHVLRFVHAADPGELRPVEFYFFVALKLIEVVRRIDGSQSQAVRLGNTVNIIGCDQSACRRHILHDHSGVAGQMLSDIGREKPRIDVICRA